MYCVYICVCTYVYICVYLYVYISQALNRTYTFFSTEIYILVWTVGQTKIKKQIDNVR